MSEYDKLLLDASRAARESATQFVPKMYRALFDENPNMTREDARDRIEKDCIEFWSKRTILEALPEDAKDPLKRKAGIQSRKAIRKRAADSAAKTLIPVTEKRQVLVTADGHQQLQDDGHDGPIQENSDASGQEDGLPMGKVSSAEELAATTPRKGMNSESTNRNEPMTLKISIPDEAIDSYRLSRPPEDKLARVTKIRIRVNRLTEQVMDYEVGSPMVGVST